jgi:hypothetical protein
MKIKPSADFSAIHAEPAIQQAKSDALMMQAESARLILVPAEQVFRLVKDLPVNLFPESLKVVQSQLQKNRN